jgi:hypothetical protein
MLLRRQRLLGPAAEGCVCQSVVVSRQQAGGSQAGNDSLQALAHAAGEAQLTNQCIVKM